MADRKGDRMTLEAIVLRLQAIHPSNIFEVDETTGDAKPWYWIDASIVHELVLYEATLTEQVQVVAAQIMRWGRLTAQAKRVWEIQERQYRIWRDRTILKLIETSGEKKAPPQWQAEAMMRATPEYAAFQKTLERAEEAYNVAHAVLDGFQAKKEMLKTAVVRSREDSAPRLSV